MPLPPPQVTQAEAMLALLALYQIVQRVLRRRLGRATRQELEQMRLIIAPLLNRHDQGC
jgi:hypothetical protein